MDILAKFEHDVLSEVTEDFYHEFIDILPCLKAGDSYCLYPGMG